MGVDDLYPKPPSQPPTTTAEPWPETFVKDAEMAAELATRDTAIALKAATTAVDAKFHATTGHDHTGVAGEGPDITSGFFHETSGHNHSGVAGEGPLVDPVNGPWQIEISPLFPAADNLNWTTNVVDATCYFNGYKECVTAQNDFIAWEVYIPAGTWVIEVMHLRNTSHGIIHVLLDDVEKGTIDTYAASPAVNYYGAVFGVVVAASGVKTLTLKMASKNASSSTYVGRIQHVRLRRTA